MVVYAPAGSPMVAMSRYLTNEDAVISFWKEINPGVTTNPGASFGSVVGNDDIVAAWRALNPNAPGFSVQKTKEDSSMAKTEAAEADAKMFNNPSGATSTSSGANGSYVTDKDLLSDDSVPVELKIKRVSKLFPPISWKRYKTLEERVEALEDALKETQGDEDNEDSEDEDSENENNQGGGSKPKMSRRRKRPSNKKRKNLTRRSRIL